ncbi:unnamed protein product, partial [Mesorhabditis spiculigera]
MSAEPFEGLMADLSKQFFFGFFLSRYWQLYAVYWHSNPWGCSKDKKTPTKNYFNSGPWYQSPELAANARTMIFEGGSSLS